MADNAEVRELVGVFRDRAKFEEAIELLVLARFKHSDISVLSSHEPVEAATEAPGKSIHEILLPFLSELKYDVPLVAAGLIALAAGPTAALVAGLVAAGVGGVALKEILGEIVASPHSKQLEQALKAGSLILWVAVEDAEREDAARAIYAEFGAEDVHIHVRRPMDARQAGAQPLSA